MIQINKILILITVYKEDGTINNIVIEVWMHGVKMRKISVKNKQYKDSIFYGLYGNSSWFTPFTDL